MTEDTVSTGEGNDQNTVINPEAEADPNAPAEAPEGMTSLSAADREGAARALEDAAAEEAEPEAAPSE